MKEWDILEAEERIFTILMDEIPEDAMSDDDCRKVAQKIAKMLETGQ